MSAKPAKTEKSVVVLIRHSPGAGGWAAEGLRVAVGYTLEESNHLSIVFLGEGVRALGPGDSPWNHLHHLGALVELGVRLVADGAALRERGIGVREGVEVLDGPALGGLLAGADVVVGW